MIITAILGSITELLVLLLGFIVAGTFLFVYCCGQLNQQHEKELEQAEANKN